MLFAFLESEHFSISFQNFTDDDDDDDDYDDDYDDDDNDNDDDDDHEDNKQLLDEVFAISRIIKVEVGVTRKTYVCFFTDGSFRKRANLRVLDMNIV